jgi:hypothetical protein
MVHQNTAGWTRGDEAAQERRLGDLAWERLTRRLAWATLALLVAYTAWYLLRYSDFNNDDLDNFMFMRSTGFWQFVLTPTNVHYVPLHRLLTWLVYHLDPMNFAVAVAVLMAFHLGTLVYLARSLHLLGLGRSSGLLVCAYAASSLVMFGLVWWAHAEHRAPYVFLDMCAVYHYLAWLRKPRPFHLVAATLAFVLAFGFYEKAVLIPLHMMVVGCLDDDSGVLARLRCRAGVPALFAVGSVAYALGYLLVHPASVQSTLVQALRGDLEFLKTLFAAATDFGMETVRDIPAHGWSLQLLALLALGGLMLAWSLKRGRGGWQVLLALGLVLLIDNLPIVLSSRITDYGLMIPRQYRFGYEELHLVILFVGLWWMRTRPAWSSEHQARLAWTAAFVLVLAYATTSALGIRINRQRPLSSMWVMSHSHAYLARLRQGLAGIHERDPVFESDPLPGFLSILVTTLDTHDLLPLFKPSIRFDDGAVPRYKVLMDGKIVKIQ